MPITQDQAKAMSPEELNRVGRDAVMLQSDAIAYASGLNIAQAGNDVVMSFSRPRPVVLPSGEIPPFMKADITAIVYTSVQTMKDFYLTLKDQVERYEALNGEIVTEYSKKFRK